MKLVPDGSLAIIPLQTVTLEGIKWEKGAGRESQGSAGRCEGLAGVAGSPGWQGIKASPEMKDAPACRDLVLQPGISHGFASAQLPLGVGPFLMFYCSKDRFLTGQVSAEFPLKKCFVFSVSCFSESFSDSLMVTRAVSAYITVSVGEVQTLIHSDPAVGDQNAPGRALLLC